MVCVVSGRLRAMKGVSDQPVHEKDFGPAVARKIDGFIAALRAGIELPALFLCCRASNAPVIACFVTEAWNRPPLFCRR